MHTLLFLFFFLSPLFSLGNRIRRPSGKRPLPFNLITPATCTSRSSSCFLAHASKFRTITGECNNLWFPTWGASGSLLTRLLRAEYSDCVGVPRGGLARGLEESRASVNISSKRHNQGNGRCQRQSLPNVREVSSTFHPSIDVPQGVYSLMVMQFGQFLDHDMALTPEVEVHDCCSHPEETDCFPIFHPREDPFYSSREEPQVCQEFTRSDAACPLTLNRKRDKEGKGKGKGNEKGKGKGKSKWFFDSIFDFLTSGKTREQYNIITSFIDGSNIYGSTEEQSKLLRTGSSGLMTTHSNFTREMLPLINGSMMAGDIRALDMPGLATIHTLFMREHNRLARLISLANPAMGDEEVYQTARRVVVGQYQSIIYGEYLPVILGQDTMQKYRINIPTNGYTNYKFYRNPAIINSFTTAAYRFGHSLIQGLVNMANPSNPASVEQVYQLRDNFFNMDKYLDQEGSGMDSILAGILGQQAQTMDRFVTEDVTNFLFVEFGENTGDGMALLRDFGSDLVARNLQRGRDHGLPGYNKFRKLCGLKSVRSMQSHHRPAEISSSNWEILSELYSSPNDIDLFVGGLGETPVADALTGPTFNCLKAIQFQRLMEGDRYFFTHRWQAGSFTEDQLGQLKARKFRDIICQNTEVTSVRSNAFLLQGELLDCSQTNQLDIELFL